MKTKDWELTVSFPCINYFKYIILNIVRVLIKTTENESKRSQNKTKKTNYCQNNRVIISMLKMFSSSPYLCELEIKFRGSGCKEMSISLYNETKMQTYQISVIFPACQDCQDASSSWNGEVNWLHCKQYSCNWFFSPTTCLTTDEYS